MGGGGGWAGGGGGGGRPGDETITDDCPPFIGRYYLRPPSPPLPSPLPPCRPQDKTNKPRTSYGHLSPPPPSLLLSRYEKNLSQLKKTIRLPLMHVPHCSAPERVCARHTVHISFVFILPPTPPPGHPHPPLAPYFC